MAEDIPSSLIQKLPQHLANQIAAGEVVQRPESVVKELVENAIDAGAEHVTINITAAGKTLIQVIDDGGGMGEHDAVLAFERHATSKIRSLDDLERIMTFGFRGEALPSIASVAKVELRTRQEGQDVATFLRIAGGTIEERSKVEGPVGTSISVRNLFYNTPARRQFLKSDATEYKHIADSVQHFVLSYPHVRITFISDGSTVYDALPGDLTVRVAYLFGDRVAESLLPVREETDLITVTGFIGRPSFARKSRGDQFLFVNGRYVVSRYLNHAVVSAYENMIDQGAFPMYILFLNIDPKQVDVNVHPAKLEVKFSNERNIYTILGAVVRQSLYHYDLTPRIAFRDTASGGTDAAGMDVTRGAGGDVADGARPPEYDQSGSVPPENVRTRFQAPDDRPEQKYDSYSSLRRGMADRPAAGGRMDPRQIDDLFRSLNIDAGQGGVPGAVRDATADGDTADTVILPSEKPVSDTQFLWQLHNKYIFTPIKSGLMIIDQHVAHERILYERGLAALESSASFAQQLLFAQRVRVSPGDFALLGELRAELEALGFTLKFSAPDSVTVEAVPQDVRPGMEERILEELLEQYKEYQHAGITDRRHNVAASYGCRAAIKAGDKLSAPEMQTLIDQLFATSNPYVCPHGRPIVIKLQLDELDRRFGRTS
ncbi:MAG: DNA mismatch repair endonuclease MutL [Bacteroidota bacterium]|jgi:DNA mismatch repair protein MutL|nr:DNA mismatch repair endonuclease MutL [Bacteroidota bacterium]